MPTTKEATAITVMIPREDLRDSVTEYSLETYVMDKLKEAGIPVRGVVLFKGVRSGTLSMRDNLELDCIEYKWIPD